LGQANGTSTNKYKIKHIKKRGPGVSFFFYFL
jgi:hypothetical protein